MNPRPAAADVRQAGLAFASLEGGPQRDLYVVLPPGGRHPLVEPTLAAPAEVASELA